MTVARTAGIARSSLVVGVAAAVASAVLMAGCPGIAGADTNRDGEWWLTKMGVTQAWSVTKGSGVKVALYDSGVDGTHPDLQGALGAGTDTTGRGSPDGRAPVAPLGPDGTAFDPADPNSRAQHGTGMAAFIAGRGHGAGNADGIIGVAPEATILSISSTPGQDTQAQATQAIHWAVDNGAKVINMSFTGSGPTKEDIGYAEQHDVVVVAGTGNEFANGVNQPASFYGVVAVGGIDADLSHDPNATYGGPGNIAGEADASGTAVVGPMATVPGSPGTGLPSATTVAQGSYTTSVGTSNSTAIVAGIVALIRAKFPTMNAANVINRLIKTATAPTGGYNEMLGYGIPDAYKALTADVPSVCENPLGSEATGSVGAWQSLIDKTSYTPKCGADGPSGSAPSSAAGASNAPTTGAAVGNSVAAGKSSSSVPFIVVGIVVVLVVLAALALFWRRRGNRPPGGSPGGSGGSGGSNGPGPGGPPGGPPQQYPGQPYPPAQYPAGQYPPQQYPTGQQYPAQQYPTSQYPAGQQRPTQQYPTPQHPGPPPAPPRSP